MNEKFEHLGLQILGLILAELLLLIACKVFLPKFLLSLQFILLVIGFAISYALVFTSKRIYRQRVTSVKATLGNDAEEAFLFGEVGMVCFDEDNVITWMSELFGRRQIDYVGEKLLSWIPDGARLLRGEVSDIEVPYKERRYQVVRYGEDRILFFRDITEVSVLRQQTNDQQVVLALIHLDNYEETTQYEEDQRVAYINAHIRQPVMDWAIDHGMILKRIRSDRFVVILNELIYRQINDENFGILNLIRQESKNYGVAITLSMSFARKTFDLVKLEEMANNGLALAQGRGGDQIVVKTYDEEDRFIGGGSEALEKRSKVRVRIMAQAIKDFALKSRKVVIVGHKQADFDCIGSALGLSTIIQNIGVSTYIAFDDNEIEAKLLASLNLYKESLIKSHQFVSLHRGLELIDDSTLVIMTDHHSLGQCMAPQLVKKASRVIVIDHHRRHGDFEFNPVLSYVEPAASSTCELVCELFDYQNKKVEISSQQSTLMYTGILIDTNRFRNRTGSRTFEAVSLLRQLGADPQEADNLLKDDYQDFEIKAAITNTAIMDKHGMMIAPYAERQVVRSLMSQVADSLLTIRDVEASFVIAYVDDAKTVAISARSRGKINVQVIMERMGGGGHFSASATQILESTVEAVTDRLNTIIDEYMEEI